MAGPALLPLGAPPLVSLHTETAALLAWGLWLAHLRGTLHQRAANTQPGFAAQHWAVLLMLALLGASASASMVFGGLPAAIGLRHLALMAGGGVALLAGARLAGAINTPAGAALLRAALLGFVLAGLGSAVVAMLQYLGIGGWWEPLGKDGRAGANLAQPNLLGTQLLWACAALVALRPRRWLLWPAACMLVIALALCASRTAAVGSLLLAAWGLLDRRLDTASRRALLAVPLGLALGWMALNLWQQVGGPGFAGTALLHKADPTSSRGALWRQCARLIAEQPWLGVGWGQFNFAWTLTPMPGLPRTAGYSFTHAHNLLVQWAVELGLPLTLVLLALLVFALWRTARALRNPASPQPLVRSAAFTMVLIVLLHSLLEFPLWHTHFLLPTCFLFGLALTPTAASLRGNRTEWQPTVAPLLMALAAAGTLLDYRSVAAVYLPPPDAAPLAQRIAQAQRSPLFGYLGGRFACTLAPSGQRSLVACQQAAFEMLDPRLLTSWALALHEGGQEQQARFVAARLREFETPLAQRFFAICASQPQAFQCLPATTNFGFRDFR